MNSCWFEGTHSGASHQEKEGRLIALQVQDTTICFLYAPCGSAYPLNQSCTDEITTVEIRSAIRVRLTGRLTRPFGIQRSVRQCDPLFMHLLAGQIELINGKQWRSMSGFSKVIK